MNNCAKCGKECYVNSRTIRDQFGNIKQICGDCARKIDMGGR